MGTRVAVDIGGTFTDAVLFEEGHTELRVGKILTTPDNLVHGTVSAVNGSDGAHAALADIATLVHGSTIVINSLIERTGAHAALLTTQGFRDVYEIGRINRPESFNLGFQKHKPLISRDHIGEVKERMRADGSVDTPLDEDAARATIRHFIRHGVTALAVALLHSYRNPSHEVRMRELIHEEGPDIFVTLSHELTREYREFERTSTTVANAYVGPIVATYLSDLQATFRSAGFTGNIAIMQSNGGLSDVATASQQAIQMTESGPAGGIVASTAFANLLGYDHAIAFDMGGTTAKASVVGRENISQAPEYFVGGYNTGLPIRIPVVDIAEIGTGGGSVAWLDPGLGLHVGPQSAGADPGPSCYGRGGLNATVTDACVVLSQLDPMGTLSGGLSLDPEAAKQAVDVLASKLELSIYETASGILQIAAAAMANAVRAVTTERGLDPRDFVLIAYGGSGPLHSSLVARELGVGRVVVPPHAAVFSAVGMLLSDMRRDFVVTEILSLTTTSLDEIEERFAAIEQQGLDELLSMGSADDRVTFLREADMRYAGQEHTVTVRFPSKLETKTWHTSVKQAFDRAHQQLYSHSAPDEEAEIVSIRVSAVGRVAKPDLTPIRKAERPISANDVHHTRSVVFDAANGPVDTPVYCRQQLSAGHYVDGPAIIQEPGTVTLLRPHDRALVESYGCLVILIGKD